jgi:DNA-binding NtrC family response regulator
LILRDKAEPGTPCEFCNSTPRRTTAGREKRMNKRHDILVIDDEPIVGQRLAVILRRDGHFVTAFTDPADALRELDQRSFDVIVCDIRMGEISGLQVLTRALEASPRAKVIMITGYATLELAKESLAKGAFDFVAKPFKIAELRKVLDKAFAALERESGPARAE